MNLKNWKNKKRNLTWTITKIMDLSINTNERVDELGRNGYRIIQNPDRFCFGMDAVLLSDFTRVKEGDKVLDFCTGTGIIPILMEAKTKATHFTALEIQEDSAEMARRSVSLNHLEEKIEIVTGDVKDADRIFEAASFHAVTCNPPYMIGQHGLVNPDSPKAIARHEILCTLDDIVKQADRVLVPGGSFYLVHRPFRLAEIVRTLSAYGLELKRLQFVHPYIDKEPNMVLLECIKGAKPRVTVEPPIIVFKEQGVYHEDIVKVYTIPGYSKEICGGPHAKNTGELVSFKILKEEASSAGVRRIKAVIGGEC